MEPKDPYPNIASWRLRKKPPKPKRMKNPELWELAGRIIEYTGRRERLREEQVRFAWRKRAEEVTSYMTLDPDKPL